LRSPPEMPFFRCPPTFVSAQSNNRARKHTVVSVKLSSTSTVASVAWPKSKSLHAPSLSPAASPPVPQRRACERSCS
jgi:hypothetical protein